MPQSQTQTDRYHKVSVTKRHSQLAGFEPTRAEPIGFQVQRLNHSATTALSTYSAWYRDTQTGKNCWRCGGSNPGPFTCKANALPLSYIPDTRTPVPVLKQSERTHEHGRSVLTFYSRILTYRQGDEGAGGGGGSRGCTDKMCPCTHGGTRTPNLWYRRPSPYPLGHAGTHNFLLSYFNITQPPHVQST